MKYWSKEWFDEYEGVEIGCKKSTELVCSTSGSKTFHSIKNKLPQATEEEVFSEWVSAREYFHHFITF